MKLIRKIIPSCAYRIVGCDVIESSDIDLVLGRAEAAIGSIPSGLGLDEVISWKSPVRVICPLHATLTGFRVVLKKKKD